MTVVAAERELEFALAEQSRCTTRFERSVGTTGEMSAYASLTAATRRVSACDRAVREARATKAPFAVTLLADATAPGEARRAVTHRLRGQADPSAVATIELLVSETVTNAVTHGTRCESETLVLEAWFDGDQFRCEVKNAGPAFDDAAELPPVTDPRGRGLFLVDALSNAWGRRHAAGVTSVWFEVAM